MKKLTEVDKERIAKLIQKHPSESNASIAKRSGWSRETVRKVRKSINAVQKDKLDGMQYELDDAPVIELETPPTLRERFDPRNKNSWMRKIKEMIK